MKSIGGGPGNLLGLWVVAVALGCGCGGTPQLGGGVGDSGGGFGSGSAPGDGPPPAAKAAGYVYRTFGGSLSPLTVDMADSRQGGFDWFLGNWFGHLPTAANSIRFNNDGSMTLDPSSGEQGVGSASPTANNRDWVGTAFGGGGYFEATLSFDPGQVLAGAINGHLPGWPSWWSLSVEHEIGSTLSSSYAGAPLRTAVLWQSQQSWAPGYSHFIEPDIMEYDYQTPVTHYLATMHDWSGTWSPANGWSSNITQGYALADMKPSPKTDFTQFHRFGLLWVPARKGSPGLIRYYFDGAAIGSDITFAMYNDAACAPPVTQATAWLFGVIDQQHLSLHLGTYHGMPLRIKSVAVWQRDSTNNVSRP